MVIVTVEHGHLVDGDILINRREVAMWMILDEING